MLFTGLNHILIKVSSRRKKEISICYDSLNDLLQIIFANYSDMASVDVVNNQVCHLILIYTL